jgi:hypothetical protein
MSDRMIVLWTIAACMSAIPVAAQAPAPATKAFDGTYAGVSRTLEGGIDRAPGAVINPQRDCWVPNGQPGPLTIAGGVARYNGSSVRRADYEGSVNAQGVLVMHTPGGSRADLQIDGRGTVTGRMMGNALCSYHMVWQKQSQ